MVESGCRSRSTPVRGDRLDSAPGSGTRCGRSAHGSRRLGRSPVMTELDAVGACERAFQQFERMEPGPDISMRALRPSTMLTASRATWPASRPSRRCSDGPSRGRIASTGWSRGSCMVDRSGRWKPLRGPASRSWSPTLCRPSGAVEMAKTRCLDVGRAGPRSTRRGVFVDGGPSWRYQPSPSGKTSSDLPDQGTAFQTCTPGWAKSPSDPMSGEYNKVRGFGRFHAARTSMSDGAPPAQLPGKTYTSMSQDPKKPQLPLMRPDNDRNRQQKQAPKGGGTQPPERRTPAFPHGLWPH